MKNYRVPRSIIGVLGPLRRNQVLMGDDPRITENPSAVKDLVKRKLLIESDDAAKPDGKRPASTKPNGAAAPESED